MEKKKPTEKRHISPVTVTVELTYNKVNEFGTLSGVKGRVVKSSVKGTEMHLSFPPLSGGAMYIRVGGLEGLEIIGTEVKPVKAKLF